MLKDENTDECESALEALGQVGTCKFVILVISYDSLFANV